MVWDEIESRTIKDNSTDQLGREFIKAIPTSADGEVNVPVSTAYVCSW
jgi:hypothetical protein